MTWIKFDEPLDDKDLNFALEIPYLEAHAYSQMPLVLPSEKKYNEWKVGDKGEMLFTRKGDYPFYRSFTVIEGPYKDNIRKAMKNAKIEETQKEI